MTCHPLLLCGCTNHKARILFLGLSNSGKTTIVHVLAKEPLEWVAPTAGFSIDKFTFRKSKLTVIDMSGASKYQALWTHYYNDQTKGIVYVVDAADTAQLPAAREALEHVLQQPQLKDVPLLVLANKQDVPGAAGPVDVSAQLGLKSITQREFTIRGCSALRGDGVQEGMSWLVQCLRQKP